MPKRVIDFDAMWGSDKLAACAAWAQAEYAWLYGLADASGCFEITNLRVIWGRVAAIRGNLTIERLEQVFAEFQDKGLLFVWEHEGKRYAHWTGSDVPGRLPAPSWRMRLERFAPAVPKQQLAEYVGRFARGRGALGGAGFRGEARAECNAEKRNLEFEISDLRKGQGGGSLANSSQMSDPRLLAASRAEDSAGDRRFEISHLKETREPGERLESAQTGGRRAAAGRDGTVREPLGIAGWNGIKECLEGTQAQGLDLDWNLDGKGDVVREEGRGEASHARAGCAEANREKESGRADISSSCSNETLKSQGNANSLLDANANIDFHPGAPRFLQMNPNGMSAKELAVWRELRVGMGPVCGPKGVRAEVLERDRQRQAARAASRSK
jgi:hypothetical protein